MRAFHSPNRMGQYATMGSSARSILNALRGPVSVERPWIVPDKPINAIWVPAMKRPINASLLRARMARVAMMDSIVRCRTPARWDSAPPGLPDRAPQPVVRAAQESVMKHRTRVQALLCRMGLHVPMGFIVR